MHNNIMAAGSRDRPPMLVTGRYAHWRSWFLRYIDTRPNGDALKKCILEGPYTFSTVVVLAVPATKNSPAVPEHITVETLQTMSPENKAHYESEKEAIHLILTGIGDEIYLTVNACKIAQEIWEAIKRNKNVDTTPRYMHNNQSAQFGNQRTMAVIGAKENNDQNDVECDDGRIALANLIENLKLDVDENKKIQNQLKKANASFTHELTECKSILAETSRTLEESNSIRDSCLVTLQTKQTAFEKYKACNDRTVDYDKLEHKLNETLGLLAQKDIDIKEALKLKAYKISVVKEKHDELVKQGLLTKSHYEGLVKEKIKVITDLKQKEDRDIDKMISMKAIKFFKRNCLQKKSENPNHSYVSTKGPTFNGRPTFSNPMYLKKAQSEKPCLYEIPNDQSDSINRLVPDRE
nr:hypothetical protein [Tanacetum cinerariifolium]